jgi:hypothetical protein
VKNTRKTLVSLSTLGSFCRDHGIQRIDFLKIDTEGNELKVLQGAKSMLQSNSIHSIQLEINEMNVVVRVFLKDFCEISERISFFVCSLAACFRWAAIRRAMKYLALKTYSPLTIQLSPRT